MGTLCFKIKCIRYELFKDTNESMIGLAVLTDTFVFIEHLRCGKIPMIDFRDSTILILRHTPCKDVIYILIHP